MKILMSALVTTATLLFAQSCLTSPNSQEPIKAVSAKLLLQIFGLMSNSSTNISS